MSKFGKILYINCFGDEYVIVYETFFDALIVKEFFENSINFSNLGTLQFEVKWFRKNNPLVSNPDLKVFLKKYLKKKSKKKKNKILSVIKEEGLSTQQNTPEFFEHSPYRNPQSYSESNSFPSNKIYNFEQPKQMNSPGCYYGKDSSDSKNKELCPYGKYTSRFDIQIENEKEFEVSKRIIGLKARYLFRGVI